MNLLYLTVLFPLVGFFLLVYSQGFWSYNVVTFIGITSIFMSMLTTFLISIDFLNKNTIFFTQFLWNWVEINKFKVPISFYLDGLSLMMLYVVTVVGFLVHVYSSWYMCKQSDYSRFFALTNLFIASMIILVLSDNIILFYLGWETVGLCSYLLISFYYYEFKNYMSAMKAFLVTGIGNILLLISICILYNIFGTLNFYNLMLLSSHNLIKNNLLIIIVSLLILGASISKSAQIPLHIWLPDAMVGPTPVSALIHSATMVTAGVYLIARTFWLFLLVPKVLYLIGIIGAFTLLFGSLAALVQSDIKRVLAYSTISQLGYMFLALGSQAWHAAIFHLFVHSFFKALLFLSAGSIIVLNNHEQNIFKLGNKLKNNSLIYFYFLCGSASLSSLPWLTSGFYSKENILKMAFINNCNLFTIVGLIGTFITSIYIFRVFFILFYSKKNLKNDFYFSINHDLPLILLSFLSTGIIAFFSLPLNHVFPKNNFTYNYHQIKLIELFSIFLSLSGLIFSFFLWLKQLNKLNIKNTIFLKHVFSFCFNICFIFDFLYEKIFILPFLFISNLLFYDQLNLIINNSIVNLINIIRIVLLVIENGKLSWYINSIFLGVLFIILLIDLLKFKINFYL